MRSLHRCFRLRRVACAMCGAGLAACSSVPLESAAPAISALPAHSLNAPQLTQGRLLYVTRCAKCHQVYPVKNYTAAQWGPILTDMAKDAKLSTAEESAVSAYVAAALRAP